MRDSSRVLCWLAWPGAGTAGRTQRDAQVYGEDRDVASCSPTPQPQHLRSFLCAPAVSLFPSTAPQCNGSNTSQRAPLAQVVLPAGPTWQPLALPAAGMRAAFQHHAAAPGPQTSPPWDRGMSPALSHSCLLRRARGEARQQDQAGPIVASASAHRPPCKHPMGLWSPHQLLHAPKSSCCLHQQCGQGRSHLSISPTFPRLPRKDLIPAIFSPSPLLAHYPAVISLP